MNLYLNLYFEYRRHKYNPIRAELWAFYYSNGARGLF